MSVTDWKNPGTAVNDSSAGTAAWQNPGNILSSNNNYAISESLIDAGTDDIKDTVVRLIDETGSIIGDNNADTVSLWSESDSVVTYGSSGDDWGNTWTASDINDSDFGVVFQADGGVYGLASQYLKATNFGFNIPSGATIDGIEVSIEKKYITTLFSDAYVDNIQARVYYTDSSTKYPLPPFKVG